MDIIRAVDYQASDDPIHESGKRFSLNHEPFNVY